jgi:hypothetical protein
MTPMTPMTPIQYKMSLNQHNSSRTEDRSCTGNTGPIGGIGVKPLLCFATAFLLASILAPALAAPRPPRPVREDVEWLWQYTPDATNKDGRENDLVQDPRFMPLLEQLLTAPQTFWGIPINGRYRSLANTALDHLTVPGKVLADDNRYISISGCTVHFCPARGLLWVDLGGPHDKGGHHLAVFAAIDWSKQGRPTTDPAAEYTLYLFPDDPLTTAAGPGLQPPPALMKDIARWAAEPLAGSGIVQNITHAMLVDPDGTTHEVAPSAFGVQPPPAPKAGTDTSAPVLKPRN